MSGVNQAGREGAGGRGITRPAGVLRLNRRVFDPGQLLVMAVVNRTPGVRWDQAGALERVHAAVADGADIVDLGGAPARPGTGLREEIRRTAAFVAAVREAHTDLVISVGTRRHEVGREAYAAGADLLSADRGGWDGRLAEVAAEFGAGLVCSDAGRPRTRPSGGAADDVLALAARAVEAGVEAARILIDPGDGPGPAGWPSAQITRRLADLAATGWPVLVSLTTGDLAGGTPGVADQERLAGTLAATAVCAWLGARVFRVYRVRETRRALRMVSAIRGDIPPARAVRGLA
jgi:dihydropteroate synthase